MSIDRFITESLMGRTRDRLLAMAGFPEARQWFSPSSNRTWWREGTVQGVILHEIMEWNARVNPPYLVLQEPYPPEDFKPGNRADIAIVAPNNADLFILEIKASFDIQHSKNDVTKLLDWVSERRGQRPSFKKGYIIFCVEETDRTDRVRDWTAKLDQEIAQTGLEGKAKALGIGVPKRA